MRGTVCKPEDLRRPEVYRGVARRLGEWHAVLPVSAIASKPSPSYTPSPVDSLLGDRQPPDANIASDIKQISSDNTAPVPNLWGIIRKWIQALPTDTEAKLKRRDQLQQELEWIVKALGDTRGIRDTPYVFSHCDLLSGNILVMPDVDQQTSGDGNPSKSTSALPVSFIDYEYATPAPAAFDISNHFAEWAGFDCDHSAIPTRSQRKEFLSHYLESYSTHAQIETTEADIHQLMDEVDRFRGIPGFYWGIWALIQALISQIDFDYASYAETRLGEYRAWKEAEQRKSKGVGPAGAMEDGVEIPTRERRWAQE